MIVHIVLAIVITGLLLWALLRLPVKIAERKRRERQEQFQRKQAEEQHRQGQVRKEAEQRAAEREKQLQQERTEEQCRREPISKEPEQQVAERQEAEEKRQQEIQVEMQKEMEAKFAAYDALVAGIQESPVVVSEDKAPKVPASFINSLTFSTITKRTDMEKLGNFVALDTETTGLKYTSDEIIEIAAVRFRAFQPVAKFSTLLAPRKPIPQEASAVNHITDEMVAGRPCFQQVAASLVEFIGVDNVVGHNLPFDLKFVVHYGADITTTKRKYFDTLALAQRTIKKPKKKWDRELGDYVEDYDSDCVSDYKLGTLCAYFGIFNMDAHRAEGDALATGMLFQKLADVRKG